MKNSALFEKWKSSFKNIFSSKKKTKGLLIVLAGLVVLIFVSMVFPGTKTDNSGSVTRTKTVSVSSYSNLIEKKIEDMILQLEKVKFVSAFVMIEATPETKYLTQETENISTNDKGVSTTSKTTTVVFEKDGSISTPVVVTTIMPKVTGVMIVMSKVDPQTKIMIQNSLSVVLNIEATCISILQES